MKNTNKKGFTLVELVVVIAVIAILAGVLLAVFASVIKRANNSAEVQNIKNAEIAQKADDIIAKIENSNWLGWEEFEASIVSKIAEVVKRDSVTGSLTADQVREIVNDAVATIKANIDQQNTGVTEDQIKAIVENAIGTLRYEGVTEAQVRAIVKAASNEVTASQLQAAQVKAIVNAANANNLTAADILVALQAGNFASTSDVNTAVGNVTTAIGNATAGLATKAQAEAILDAIEAINVNVTTDELDDVITAKSLNIRIKGAGLTKANTPYEVFEKISFDVVPTKKTILLSIEDGQLGFFVVNEDQDKIINSCGLTITEIKYYHWTFANEVSPILSTYLKAVHETVEPNGVGLDVGQQTINTIDYTNDGEEAHSVVIRTNGGTLNIDAEDDNVTHYGEVDELNIIAVANMSYHEYGNVIFASIKTGHIAFEKNSSIKAVHILANDNQKFDPVIISFKENVEQPNYSRDNCNIDDNGTKVCTLALPTETNNIILFKQGIYEQIKLQPTTIADEQESTSTNAKIWITEDENATDETKIASDQLANIFGNRASALVEEEGQDTPVLNSDKDFTTLDQASEVVTTKPSVEEKKNEALASVYVRAQVDDINLNVNPIHYSLYAYNNYANEAYLDKAFIFKGFTDEEFALMEKLISAKDEDDNNIFNINSIDIGSLSEENIGKALTYVENTYGVATRQAIEKIIAQKTPYFDWICDFEVSFDRDIAEGSIALAGYYDIFANNYYEGEWLGFGMPAISSSAEPIRLLNAMFGFSENSDFHMPYIAILAIVQQFSCGVTNLDNVNEGTTITVELCIYNYDSEGHQTDRIVCGTYKYKFGKVSTVNNEIMHPSND